MTVIGVTARVDHGKPAREESQESVLGADDLDGVSDEARASDEDDEESADEWARMWAKAVKRFIGNEEVVETLRETYTLTRDFQMFRRIMTFMALDLSATSPHREAGIGCEPPVLPAPLSVATQYIRASAATRIYAYRRYSSCAALPYPAVCLLIQSMHAQTSGHDVFTFEMLHNAFKSPSGTAHSKGDDSDEGEHGALRLADVQMEATTPADDETVGPPHVQSLLCPFPCCSALAYSLRFSRAPRALNTPLSRTKVSLPTRSLLLSHLTPTRSLTNTPPRLYILFALVPNVLVPDAPSPLRSCVLYGSAPVTIPYSRCYVVFERLVELHVFRPAAGIAREFALHLSMVDRFVVRKAVETIGQLNLKKWLKNA
ncbi:hypothetical protein C8Q80DRAFT_1276152 [Daedaleopsis nitida]|nr:hypothetical protein C8Q80DRAFT_1276152 [Daedaleopsis nitida]